MTSMRQPIHQEPGEIEVRESSPRVAISSGDPLSRAERTMGIALFLLTLLAPALGQIKVVGNCKCDPTVSRSQSVKCSFSDGKLHTASTSEQPIQHGLEVRFHPAERANPRAPVPVGARPVATFCRLLRLPLRPAASPALPLRTTPGPRLTLPPYPCISRPPSGRVPAAQFKCIASGTHDGANC